MPRWPHPRSRGARSRGALLRVVSSVALTLYCVGCDDGLAPRADPAQTPRVERVADGWQIRWDHAPGGATVEVFRGVAADTIDRSRPVATLVDGAAHVAGANAGDRPFFEVVSGDGRHWTITERRLPLEGAANFRDLGGYRTRDGRTTRWGRVYRSGELSELTDRDLEVISRLGIRLVCDFRGPSELAEDPDRLPEDPAPEILGLPIFDGRVDAIALRNQILSGDTDGTDFAQLLIDGNQEFVNSASDRYGQMFERLAAPGGLPAVVHCTAGKDRAGFAAAIVLMALGVPEETVFADYLLTNHYTARQTDRMLFGVRLLSMFRTDPEDVRPLFEARPEYLQAAMDAIEDRHGSFDAYLQDGLGISDATLAALRAALLQ